MKAHFNMSEIEQLRFYLNYKLQKQTCEAFVFTFTSAFIIHKMCKPLQPKTNTIYFVFANMLFKQKCVPCNN